MTERARRVLRTAMDAIESAVIAIEAQLAHETREPSVDGVKARPRPRDYRYHGEVVVGLNDFEQGERAGYVQAITDVVELLEQRGHGAQVHYVEMLLDKRQRERGDASARERTQQWLTRACTSTACSR